MSQSTINKFKKGYFPKLIIVLMLVLLAFFVVGAIREYLKRAEVDREKIELEQELALLQMDKNDFLKSIDDYKSDFFVEQEARTKFNLKKQGEKVVIIPTENLAGSEQERAQQAEILEQVKDGHFQNLKIWWDYFFGDPLI